MFSTLSVVPQTAASIFDLTDVATVNAEFRLTSSTANDAAVGAQITAASQIIATLCDRVFALESVVETFKIRWHDRVQSLVLSRFPVTEIVSITVDDIALAADDYILNNDNGMVYSVHAPFHGTIVATYAGGYDLPDEAPAALARACIELIRDQRSISSVGSNILIRSVSAGENNVSYFDSRSNRDAQSPAVMNLIATFKRPSVV